MVYFSLFISIWDWAIHWRYKIRYTKAPLCIMLSIHLSLFTQMYNVLFLCIYFTVNIFYAIQYVQNNEVSVFFFVVTGYCSYDIFNRTDTTLLFTTINYSLKLNNLASQDTSFKVSVKTYTYTCYRSFYNAIYIEYIRDTYINKEAIFCTRRV